MITNRKQQGIALVTVLGIAMVVLALLMVITNLSVRGARVTSRDVTSIQLVQLADGYSDQARLTLAKNYVDSKLSLSKWVGKITPDANASPQVISPTDPLVSALAGIHERIVSGTTLRWKIKNLNAKQAGKASIEVHTTAIDSSGNAQTVIRQVWFGNNEIFDLALLSERVDCMFCHLNVKGDVGSLDLMRPGWGKEGDNETSGKGSIIDGDVYSAKTVTKDKLGTDDINGATLTSGKKLNENYIGDKLPKGDDGKPAFPGLDRVAIAGSANGSISGGSIRTVGPNGTWSSGPASSSGISKTFDGNVVLEGTDANPIVLNGDVYVSGDVVIKGVVKGRGAIYAGRNMYVAGNLTNKNKADKPGDPLGVCKTIADDDAGRNECAVKNIAASKDETRLSAGNNMVLGDYTEQKADLTQTSLRDRQSADYFRSQFGLYPGETRYVRKGSSEELRYDSVTNKYYDQVNREVSAAQVQSVGGAGVDPYRPLIAPGSTDAGGNFKSWMSDAEYQNILGTESISSNTWRSEYGTKSNEPISEADKIAKFTAELEDAGLPKNDPQTVAIATALAKREKLEGPSSKYSGTDKDGNIVSGYANVSLDKYGNPTLRVSINEARNYRQETTALDAFLYANSRIAGKLSPRGGYINGGMIARQIGVLAPGKNGDNGWWIDDAAERKSFTDCDKIARPTDTTDDAANVGTDCNYSINYDYRLRNGGYGYNYYRGVTGATREWKLDETGNAKVIP
jgi:hypothetical protein